MKCLLTGLDLAHEVLAHDAGIKRLIMKPLTAREVSKTVRDVLDDVQRVKKREADLASRE